MISLPLLRSSAPLRAGAGRLAAARTAAAKQAQARRGDAQEQAQCPRFRDGRSRALCRHAIRQADGRGRCAAPAQAERTVAAVAAEEGTGRGQRQARAGTGGGLDVGGASLSLLRQKPAGQRGTPRQARRRRLAARQDGVLRGGVASTPIRKEGAGRSAALFAAGEQAQAQCGKAQADRGRPPGTPGAKA